MYGTYCRLEVSTFTSDQAVIRAAWRKLAPKGKSRAQRDERRKFFSIMLEYHHGAQETVQQFRL